jgi:hypothetical protein
VYIDGVNDMCKYDPWRNVELPVKLTKSVAFVCVASSRPAEITIKHTECTKLVLEECIWRSVK